MNPLRQHLIGVTVTFLRSGSVCIYDASGVLLVELPITGMRTQGEGLAMDLDISTIVRSGQATRAILKLSDGTPVEDLSVGDEDADITFDSLTFVQGDRVALTLVGAA